VFVCMCMRVSHFSVPPPPKQVVVQKSELVGQEFSFAEANDKHLVGDGTHSPMTAGFNTPDVAMTAGCNAPDVPVQTNLSRVVRTHVHGDSRPLPIPGQGTADQLERKPSFQSHDALALASVSTMVPLGGPVSRSRSLISWSVLSLDQSGTEWQSF